MPLVVRKGTYYPTLKGPEQGKWCFPLLIVSGMHSCWGALIEVGMEAMPFQSRHCKDCHHLVWITP